MSSSSTRLYLAGLPEFAGVEEITKHLSGYGKLVEVKLHPSGYGFVQFDKQKDASDVLATFSCSSFMGKKITVEYARPLRKAKLENNFTTRDDDGYNASVNYKARYPVIVTNMSPNTCWQELKDFGRMAGGFVAFCDIDKPRNGKGFIEYSSRNAANRAVRKLSGKTLSGNIVKLYHREDYENRKSTTRHRSRSPPRDCSIYKYPSAAQSYAGPSLHAIDEYPGTANTRGRPPHKKQRSRASTGTSNTEPSLEQIDPYAYVNSRRAARDAPSSARNDYDNYLRGRYEEREWELHQAGVGYYDDPRWAYYM